MRDRAAACLRFTLCLLSLDGDEASECGQTGKARRDANQHCCGSPAKNTHPREPSKQSCNYTTTSNSTPKSHKPPKDSFSLLFFPHFVICLCSRRDKVYEFHSLSAGTFRSFIIPLCIFVFSFAPCANIFPLYSAPSSFLLTILSSPLLLPILPSIPFSTPLMPAS